MFMKKTALKAIAASAAALICASAIVITSVPENIMAASAKVNDATVQRYEENIKNLEREQKKLLNDLQAVRNDRANQLAYKAKLDQAVYAFQIDIENLDAMIAELETKILETTADIETKKQEIQDLKVQFIDRMRVAYEEGDISYIEMILGSESMSDFFSRIEWIGSIMEYDRLLSEKFETEKASLEKSVTDLNNAIEKQEQAKTKLEADKVKYSQLAAECENYIASLAADEAAYQKAYAMKKAKEEELDRDLTKYLKSLQEKKKKEYVGGVFQWPLPLANKRISSYFGVRTLNGIKETHGAIDIPAPVNTAIYAANSGTVLRAEYHYSYGNYVLIDHGGGQSTLYAHCNSILVSVGDNVKKGQTIAKVGTTGHSTGYHLHFEVRLNGKRVDPLGYVNQP